MISRARVHARARKAVSVRSLSNTDTDVGFVTGALARLGRDFRIFAGLELPTLPMLAIGGCGMMITASNVAPHLVAQLYETFAKGDIDGAIAL
jgi:4-hydroxy-tetrahydrodipicolinate synthase